MWFEAAHLKIVNKCNCFCIPKDWDDHLHCRWLSWRRDVSTAWTIYLSLAQNSSWCRKLARSISNIFYPVIWLSWCAFHWVSEDMATINQKNFTYAKFILNDINNSGTGNDYNIDYLTDNRWPFINMWWTRSTFSSVVAVAVAGYLALGSYSRVCFLIKSLPVFTMLIKLKRHPLI